MNSTGPDLINRCMSTEESSSSWACSACTFNHVGERKKLYLSCEVCRTKRVPVISNEESSIVVGSNNVSTTVPCRSSKVTNCAAVTPLSSTRQQQRKSSLVIPTAAEWGSLRRPTNRDVIGPRKRRKVFDAPDPMMDFLVVLDLEWTADNRQRMDPIGEITQLPSVVMKIVDRRRKWTQSTTATNNVTNVVTSNTTVLLPPKETKDRSTATPVLPVDLSVSCSFSNSSNTMKADAYAVSAFDTFVRPTFNPKLTQFSIDLTAITQSDVDAAPTIDIAFRNYMDWLGSLDLVDEDGCRKGNWCFVTWGDVDIMTTLRQELQLKSIRLPPCFYRWINLKHDSMYKKHYGREPKGGLRACVERIGSTWEGRAHNGLIDSYNTAKIVMRASKLLLIQNEQIQCSTIQKFIQTI